MKTGKIFKDSRIIKRMDRLLLSAGGNDMDQKKEKKQDGQDGIVEVTQETNHEVKQMNTARGGTPKADRKKVMIVLLIAIVILAGGIFIYVNVQNEKVRTIMRQEGIYPGVSVDGLSLEGKSREEAVEALEAVRDKEAETQNVTLTFGEEKWTFSFRDVGAKYSVKEAVEIAYDLGRVGTEKDKFHIVAALQKTPEDIPLVFTYDAAMLESKMSEIEADFNREVADSSMTRKNGGFVITKEAEGRAMDLQATSQKVGAVIASMKGGSVEIVAHSVVPQVTYEDNAQVTDLIGSFSTKYTMNRGDRDRNTNLEVGAKYMNGTIIASGETYSATEGLGSQTYEGGYRNAGVYVNGKVEDGMAGGVCQITTTLYNAAIFAELEIVERHPHSMTVGYVPLGRDAAIAGDYKDLRIKNNTPYPIYIEAYASNGTLGVNLYGREAHDAGRKVAFETVFEASIPKPADIIKKDPEKTTDMKELTHKGRTGSKVSVYKKVSENGVQTSKEWFSSSSYRSVADEYTIGTKAIEVIAVPETPEVVTDIMQ